MVVGSNLFNFGQFIYHFLAGRMLGKVYYGDVAAIIAILALVGIVQLSLNLAVVKFVAVEKTEVSRANLARWLNWWTLWTGIVVSIAVFAASPKLTEFLNIQERLAVYILTPGLLVFILLNTQRAILQGLLAFRQYVTSLLVEVVAKLLLTVVFIFLGFAVAGAIGAIFIGTACALVLTRFFLADYVGGRRGKMPHIKPLLIYSLPVFIQGVALTSMYSTDLILVKHFFHPAEAGIYASLAVLGRIAFFGASPVAQVMFPLVARRHSHGEQYHRIFYLSILLTAGITSLVILFYVFVPELAIRLLFGDEFIDGAPILWWFGLFMGLLTLANLFIQYYLSIGKTKIVSLFAIAAILQIALIWFIHPNLQTVIKMSTISAALLTTSLLVYFPYHHPILLKGFGGTSNK